MANAKTQSKSAADIESLAASLGMEPEEIKFSAGSSKEASNWIKSLLSETSADKPFAGDRVPDAVAAQVNAVDPDPKAKNPTDPGKALRNAVGSTVRAWAEKNGVLVSTTIKVGDNSEVTTDDAVILQVDFSDEAKAEIEKRLAERERKAAEKAAKEKAPKGKKA